MDPNFKIKENYFCNRPLSPLYPSSMCRWEYYMDPKYFEEYPTKVSKQKIKVLQDIIVKEPSVEMKKREETNFVKQNEKPSHVGHQASMISTSLELEIASNNLILETSVDKVLGKIKKDTDLNHEMNSSAQIEVSGTANIVESENALSQSKPDMENYSSEHDIPSEFEDNDGYDSDLDPEFTPGMIGLTPWQLKSRRLQKYLSSSSSFSDNNAEGNNTFIENSQEVNDSSQENVTNKCNELVTKDDKEDRNMKNRKIGNRKPDFCFFCETEVLNFARHITRNHSAETDVQKIICKPKKSEERRQLLATLKKRGNYLKNFNATDCFKPRKISNLPDTKFLPCVHCLGFYSSKQLRRHRGSCSENPQKNTSTVRDSNARLSLHIKVDAELRTSVFGHMQADKVSLVAQQDTLICAFGSRYLKLHREKHMINVVSRKMRELAKVLIELKKMQPSIKNMLTALNPKYFDLFVAATKILAKFNPHSETYESPTFAMNIATSLKQCCDIAINLALKKSEQFEDANTDSIEKDLKNMIFLFKTNWKFEISSQAGNDLNSKTWNKITIIPLATDLKLLKDYLNKRAQEAICDLIKENSDRSTYKTLLETIYCRLILLNRKRPGELQRMKYHVYNNNINQSAETYQEFDNVISATEKILLHKFKRIVIRGKRGRGVPVLVSQDVQQHLEILNQHRSNFVHANNPYLFALPNDQVQSVIYGYKVLQKYAKQSGAKNPSALTSTRLRKHLATLSQIFNMREEELEQLAKFMGHTLSVHKNSYRLPDDVYQTAKVSKLLMLMENGQAADFKGKSLDEIEIDLEDDLLNSNLNEKDAREEHWSEIESDDDTESNSVIASQSIKNPKDKERQFVKYETKKKARKLVPWTTKQTEIVTEFFAKHIKMSKPPKRSECEELKEKYPELANKNWTKIKVFVQNIYTKKRKL